MPRENDLEDDPDKGLEQFINHPQFIEHPTDAFISGKNPAMVQCVVKRAHKALIECNAKVRDETRSSISLVKLMFASYFFFARLLCYEILTLFKRSTALNMKH